MLVCVVSACIFGSVSIARQLIEFGGLRPDNTFARRVNISNAAVLGLKEDLDIVHGTKYNTALTIFFVPYILFEIPSNVLLKKLKPHVWCML